MSPKSVAYRQCMFKCLTSHLHKVVVCLASHLHKVFVCLAFMVYVYSVSTRGKCLLWLYQPHPIHKSGYRVTVDGVTGFIKRV